MPAAAATSRHTSRLRRARAHIDSALLSGHGDEAEIAHRGAVRLCIAVDHDDPQSAPGTGEGRGQPHDASADYGEVKAL